MKFEHSVYFLISLIQALVIVFGLSEDSAVPSAFWHFYCCTEALKRILNLPLDFLIDDSVGCHIKSSVL